MKLLNQDQYYFEVIKELIKKGNNGVDFKVINGLKTICHTPNREKGYFIIHNKVYIFNNSKLFKVYKLIDINLEELRNALQFPHINIIEICS